MPFKVTWPTESHSILRREHVKQANAWNQQEKSGAGKIAVEKHVSFPEKPGSMANVGRLTVTHNCR